MRELKRVKALGSEDRSSIQKYIEKMDVDTTLELEMVIPIERTPITDMMPYPHEKPINLLPVRTEPKIGRNQDCPCGSGKKFKKCCINKR